MLREKYEFILSKNKDLFIVHLLDFVYVLFFQLLRTIW